MYNELVCLLHSVSDPNSRTNTPIVPNMMHMNSKEYSRKLPLGQSDSLLLKLPEK
jgi:hypothetical protein